MPFSTTFAASVPTYPPIRKPEYPEIFEDMNYADQLAKRIELKIEESYDHKKNQRKT